MKIQRWLSSSGLAAALATPPQKNLEAELGAARHREEVEGDYAGAVEAYKKIVAGGASRAVAAKALVRIGQCYEKLGDAEARKAYERVTREFADQKEAAAQARTRLAVMDSATLRGGGRPVLRKLAIESPENLYFCNVSSDGRYFGAYDQISGNPVVVDVATGKSRTVVDYGTWDDEKGDAAEAVVSRNGKEVAYWLHSGRQEDALHVARIDGRAARVLYRRPVSDRRGEFVRPWDWSPDGKHLVVSIERGHHARGGSGRQPATDIALMSLVDGNVTVVRKSALTHYTGIQFSLDGRFLAFDFPREGARDEADVRVLRWRDGHETIVAPHPARDRVARLGDRRSGTRTARRTARRNPRRRGW